MLPGILLLFHPYRTLQDWELGKRTMPEYLLRLMFYKVKMEKLMKEDVDERKG